jgi:hypothetical protein
MAICIRGRYRFAVEAKTGLPERDQVKVKRVHFRSVRFPPQYLSAAWALRMSCPFAFGACIKERDNAASDQDRANSGSQALQVLG